MPRYRKLHTKITESFDVNDMPDDFTRLLWTWLMLGADRAGRMPDNPALVKAKVMPLRADVSNEQVAAALDWYAGHGMITRYTVSGRRFFYLTHFAELQGDTSKEAASVYPDPPTFNSDTGQELVESSARPEQDLRKTDSGTDAQGDASTDASTEAESGDEKPSSPAPAATPRKPKRDQRTDHPAIKAVSAVTGKRPPLEVYDRIIATVGDTPDVERMADVFQRWRAHGYSPVNLEGWLFDWYVAGVPPARASPNGARAPNSALNEPAGFAAIREARRRREANHGEQ